MSEKKKRDPRHYLRRFLISGFLCFLIVAILVANLPEIRKAWWQWQLNQAQKKWEQNEPSHYRYLWVSCQRGCFYMVITVKNGEIVEATILRHIYNVDGEYVPAIQIEEPVDDLSRITGLTIESEFQRVQSGLDSVTTPLRVEYDGQYGFPKVEENLFCDFVGINPITGYCDVVTDTIFVRNFEVLE